MNVLAPDLLWATLAIVPLALWLLYRERARGRIISALGLISQHALILRVIIPLMVTALILIALARPYLGSSTLPVVAPGRDILAVVDISASMRTADLPPSRLEYAKRKLLDLVARLRQGDGADRAGIVLYAGAAYLYCPLTSDYDVLSLFISSIATDLISAPGSVLEEALRTAYDSLKNGDARSPALVILTDGEDRSFDPSAAANLSSDFGSPPLLVLGVGTPEGGLVTERDGSPLRDENGEVVHSTLYETSLHSFAELAGGRYKRATLSDSDFDPLFERSNLFPDATRDAAPREVTVYREIGSWLVLAALVLSILPIARFGLPVVIFGVSLVAAPLHAEAAPSDQGGALSYHERREVERQAEAAYRSERYDEAAVHYRTLTEAGTSGRERHRAYYNLGNSLFRLGRYGEAVTEYEKALSLSPSDELARHNRDLARLREAELPTPTPTPTFSATQSPDSSSSQQSSSSASSSDSSSATSRSDPMQTSSDASSQGGEMPTPSTPDPAPSSDPGTPTPPPSPRAPSPSPLSSEPPEDRSANSLTPTPQSLTSAEARAWLDSLADSPLLLRRKVGPNRSGGGQRW